jgi:hypothetical protein
MSRIWVGMLLLVAIALFLSSWKTWRAVWREHPSGMRRTWLTVILAALAIILFFGTRHDSGRAMQRFGEYEAALQVNRWHLFEIEVYRNDTLSVIPSYSGLDVSKGDGIRRQHQIFGSPIGVQDDMFGFGDRNHGNYDQEAAFKYILQTKFQSENPVDRIWFIISLWTERYTGQRADVESLVADKDGRVREAAKQRLEYLAK